MGKLGIVLLVIAIVLVVTMVVLYFLGKKAQKKKEEQDEQMKAVAQTVTMLVIDKKRMKLRDAGLPAQVMEQTNKMMQRAKMPIVKAKVGPKITTFIADEQILMRFRSERKLRQLSVVFTSPLSGVFVVRWKSRKRRKRTSGQSFRQNMTRPMPS